VIAPHGVNRNPLRRHAFASSTGNASVLLTYPQFSHAAWGSLALRHLGHRTRFTGRKAWCDRRLRLQHFDVFPTGSMVSSRQWSCEPALAHTPPVPAYDRVWAVADHKP